jgi:hypothetical protein
LTDQLNHQKSQYADMLAEIQSLKAALNQVIQTGQPTATEVNMSVDASLHSDANASF